MDTFWWYRRYLLGSLTPFRRISHSCYFIIVIDIDDMVSQLKLSVLNFYIVNFNDIVSISIRICAHRWNLSVSISILIYSFFVRYLRYRQHNWSCNLSVSFEIDVDIVILFMISSFLISISLFCKRYRRYRHQWWYWTCMEKHR